MKTRTATIVVTDIMFDVNAATHLFASVNDAKDFRRFDALETDSEDGTILAMLFSSMEGRLAELKRNLSRFLTSASTTASADTQLSLSATSVVFSFNVEDGFQDELLAPLTQKLKLYLSTGIIADWYRAAGDAMSAAFEKELPQILTDTMSLLVKRKFPTRT